MDQPLEPDWLEVPLNLCSDPIPRVRLRDSIIQHIDLILHARKKYPEGGKAPARPFPGDFPFDPDFGFDAWYAEDNIFFSKKILGDDETLAKNLFLTIQEKEQRLQLISVEIYPWNPKKKHSEKAPPKLVAVNIKGMIKETGEYLDHPFGTLSRADLGLRWQRKEKPICYPKKGGS